MSSLDSSIDALYRGALDEFVAARNALAKSVKGDAARQVKQLQKPTSVAWAVNQLYWHKRPVYDRLLKSGKKLRTAQIGALSGQRVNIREPAEEHRAAIAQAVTDTLKLTADAGFNPNTEELSRTFEALSLETEAAEAAGRLTKALQPAGFEALAGLVVKAPPHPHTPRPAAAEGKSARETARHDAAKHEAAKHAAAERQAREREEEAANHRRSEAIKKATEAVNRAQAAEDRARSEWERCKKEREAAEQALAELQ